jgi:hypothetical protein
LLLVDNCLPKEAFLLFAVFFFITPFETALSTVLTAEAYASFIVVSSLESKEVLNFLRDVFNDVLIILFSCALT